MNLEVDTGSQNVQGEEGKDVKNGAQDVWSMNRCWFFLRQGAPRADCLEEDGRGKRERSPVPNVLSLKSSWNV